MKKIIYKQVFSNSNNYSDTRNEFVVGIASNNFEFEKILETKYPHLAGSGHFYEYDLEDEQWIEFYNDDINKLEIESYLHLKDIPLKIIKVIKHYPTVENHYSDYSERRLVFTVKIENLQDFINYLFAEHRPLFKISTILLLENNSITTINNPYLTNN